MSRAMRWVTVMQGAPLILDFIALEGTGPRHLVPELAKLPY